VRALRRARNALGAASASFEGSAIPAAGTVRSGATSRTTPWSPSPRAGTGQRWSRPIARISRCSRATCVSRCSRC